MIHYKNSDNEESRNEYDENNKLVHHIDCTSEYEEIYEYDERGREIYSRKGNLEFFLEFDDKRKKIYSKGILHE